MSGKVLKSKDARKALRRWGFTATLTHSDGSVSEKKMPGAFFGDQGEAIALISDLTSRFMEANPSAKSVVIKPIAFETISFETRQQLYAMSNQASLVMQAAYLLADAYRIATKIETSPDEIVHAAIKEADEIRKIQVADPNGYAELDDSLVSEPEKVIEERKAPRWVATLDELRKEA